MILIPEPDKVKEAEVRAAQAAPEEKPLPEVERLRKELDETKNQLSAEKRNYMQLSNDYRQLEQEKNELQKQQNRWQQACKELRAARSQYGIIKVLLNYAKDTGVLK
ncbi:hypothetical protein DW855_06855 [Faecalibacterium prausnitzii]|uniref:Uncharacterized protein n=1 Tax=Faecalibacterium prausnitzii TaxID=853 RepID=A0A3E2W5Z8_9FIRM|nr:hypothetical protein DW855_06855 [Faecalibacterium prausnitzii]